MTRMPRMPIVSRGKARSAVKTMVWNTFSKGVNSGVAHFCSLLRSVVSSNYSSGSFGRSWCCGGAFLLSVVSSEGSLRPWWPFLEGLWTLGARFWDPSGPFQGPKTPSFCKKMVTKGKLLQKNTPQPRAPTQQEPLSRCGDVAPASCNFATNYPRTRGGVDFGGGKFFFLGLERPVSDLTLESVSWVTFAWTRKQHIRLGSGAEWLPYVHFSLPEK